MITTIKAYRTSDGTAHATLEEAQEAELSKLIADGAVALKFEHFETASTVANENDAMALATWLLANRRNKLVDILTTGPKSRPTRRLVNGAKAPRRSKAAMKAAERQQAGEIASERLRQAVAADDAKGVREAANA